MWAPLRQAGTWVENHSEFEPLVMLKHLSNHPGVPQAEKGAAEMLRHIPRNITPDLMDADTHGPWGRNCFR